MHYYLEAMHEMHIFYRFASRRIVRACTYMHVYCVSQYYGQELVYICVCTSRDSSLVCVCDTQADLTRGKIIKRVDKPTISNMLVFIMANAASRW
jgi:hypothetical protein